ncbi:MAG: hypothetical protein WCP38_02900 [Chloroflexota bacterium]|jgi:hypothetical protein
MESKNLYIIAGAASLALSIAFYFGIGVAEDHQHGIYIGLWVPAILSLGNLLAKKGK